MGSRHVLVNIVTRWLPTSLCVFLLLTLAEGRPQTDEALLDLSAGKQHYDDLWKPKLDKDKWRAFEPVREISTSQWWKEKLDDNLWDYNSHKATTNSLQETPLTHSGLGTTFRPVSATPEELCTVDYECRAARTCVSGVCKCFTPAMCGGNHKPVCGSDGILYASHCDLHRTACINHVHIRADRHGRCFQNVIQEKEKSWLLEQEMMPQSDKPRVKTQPHQPANIPSDEKSSQPPQATKKESSEMSGPPGSEVKQDIVTEKITTTAKVSEASKECTWKEMRPFIDSLLMYYCQKFVEPDCKMEVKTDRDYLAMLMFSFYDKDYDFYLTTKELDDNEQEEHFGSGFITTCHLRHFMKHADTLEVDGKLTVSEFTNVFELPVPTLPPKAKMEVITTLATAGNGLELKCGVDSDTIVWRRHGTQLSDDKRNHQIMVFDDGALFFSSVGLHHIGNYSCMDASDETNAQLHQLRVQTMPVVEVTPTNQVHTAGSDIELKCHVEGVPVPAIVWKFEGELLQNSPQVTHYYDGGQVVIHNAKSDVNSGIYTCSAHNQAGITEKSVSVSILSPLSSSSVASAKEAGTFMVFHSKGVSAYDPLRCLLMQQVSGDFNNFKFIPDALDGPLTLCRKNEDCRWAGAVMVGSRLIYVSQPDQNRVVVFDASSSWHPVQVIDTDLRPAKLSYVAHLDQVWVLCGSQEQGAGNRTIVVIRDASQHIQHHAVHTQPVGNHFDMVQDLFIAPQNDLQHKFDFGYVSHSGQNGLSKLNLEDMSYTKAIDLTNYGCIPINIAFVPIGGHVVVQCVSAADQQTLQLIIDYLTDTVTSAISRSGHPMASPDSRYVVTVDGFTGKVTVISVSDEGVLVTAYEVTVSESISYATFMTAMSHHGYDLVLTSAENDDISIMNLATGKVEKLKGSQYSDSSSFWLPFPGQRFIVPGNSLSNYLMAQSKSSLVILDARFKQLECEFKESVNTDVMVHIPSSYRS